VGRKSFTKTLGCYLMMSLCYMAGVENLFRRQFFAGLVVEFSSGLVAVRRGFCCVLYF
jgi:hypothetical protein